MQSTEHQARAELPRSETPLQSRQNSPNAISAPVEVCGKAGLVNPVACVG
jgi:hypothetical protein